MTMRPGRRPMRREEMSEIRRRLSDLRRRHMENTRDFERLERLMLILLAGGYAPYDDGYDDYDQGSGFPYGGSRDRGDNHYMGGMGQGYETIGGMEYGQDEVPVMAQGHSGFYGFDGDPFGPLDQSELH